MEKLSRRQFLKVAGTGLVAATVPEGISRGRSMEIANQRQERPLLLDSVPDNSISFGLTPHNDSLEFALQTGEALGKKPHIVGFFINGNHPFTDNPPILEQIRAAQDAGMIVELHWGGSMHYVDLVSLSEELARIGNDFLWRPWFEMNGSWTQSWYGGFAPSQFVSAWERMWNYFSKEKHLSQAKFVFCPNTTDIASPIEPFFPGEDKVHLVSLDAYLKHRFNPLDSRHYVYPYLSPEELLGPDLALFQRLAPQTPFIQSEINTSIETDPDIFLWNRLLPRPIYGRGEWLAAAANYLVKAGAVAWLSFDWNKAEYGNAEDDWAMVNYPEVVASMAGELSKSYYQNDLDLGADKTWTKLGLKT